jgi:hypothetical protein
MISPGDGPVKPRSLGGCDARSRWHDEQSIGSTCRERARLSQTAGPRTPCHPITVLRSQAGVIGGTGVEHRDAGLDSRDAQQGGPRAEPEKERADLATGEHADEGRGPTRPRQRRPAGRTRAERQHINECLDQTDLHRRGRHVRDRRLDHRAAAPPHRAREQHDHDGPRVFRETLRSADNDGVHAGAGNHGDLAGERGQVPAPSPPAHRYDDGVGSGHASHESS